MKLIVEKHDYPNLLRIVKIIECNKLTSKFYTWWYKKKGYEVEEIE